MKNQNNINTPLIEIGTQLKIKTPSIDISQGNVFAGYKRQRVVVKHKKTPSEILLITSFPPRECGIASYSQDLMKAIKNKFSNSLSIKICALESESGHYNYTDEVKYVLNTSEKEEYATLGILIDKDKDIDFVVVQHEFGFFRGRDKEFITFLKEISKPIVIVFHTVIPNPNKALLTLVKNISSCVSNIVVMTHNSEGILITDYKLPQSKITVIAHGTHLVSHIDNKALKIKYGLENRKVLTTFGLLSSGKSIETTIDAMPSIIKESPEVVFLIIGKTHPEVVKNEGEIYRKTLKAKITSLGLGNHVIFINKYLDLPVLLEYLQLTDIYLFTTKDPNQAVSGTFVYAMSCACPIISTPIPHAREILTEDTGIIFDFGNSEQLSQAVIRLMRDETLRTNISSNTLHKIVPTAWENSAIAHVDLFRKMSNGQIEPDYNLPAINLSHIKKLTTEKGMIQFSELNQPDINTGYTLDDNARALIAMCMYYQSTKNNDILTDIRKYLRFIKTCQQKDGSFLNYMDEDGHFTPQNGTVNLDDSNGRAIWALGFTVSLNGILPDEIVNQANLIIEKSKLILKDMFSTRAISFSLKGLYYQNFGLTRDQEEDNSEFVPISYNHKPLENGKGDTTIIRTLANRLKNMFEHEHSKDWEWYEPYLTYANSIVPEAMLYAWMLTGEKVYKEIAVTSFDFLLTNTFNKNGIEVISNRNWLKKGEIAERYGQQPIDVAYTIMTLSVFYDLLKSEKYQEKMEISFNWFLGHNHLRQIVYNPSTGGCYDGLEKSNVNLNQGAESTVSYLMARLTLGKYEITKPTYKIKRTRVFP